MKVLKSFNFAHEWPLHNLVSRLGMSVPRFFNAVLLSKERA